MLVEEVGGAQWVTEVEGGLQEGNGGGGSCWGLGNREQGDVSPLGPGVPRGSRVSGVSGAGEATGSESFRGIGQGNNGMKGNCGMSVCGVLDFKKKRARSERMKWIIWDLKYNEVGMRKVICVGVREP